MQVKFMREEIMRAINIVNRGVTKDSAIALGTTSEWTTLHSDFSMQKNQS